jgi:hypothetical protein
VVIAILTRATLGGRGAVDRDDRIFLRGKYPSGRELEASQTADRSVDAAILPAAFANPQLELFRMF